MTRKHSLTIEFEKGTDFTKGRMRSIEAIIENIKGVEKVYYTPIDLFYEESEKFIAKLDEFLQAIEERKEEDGKLS